MSWSPLIADQIFLGTPHRFQSTYDAEDQLCKLVLLPGPEIEDRTLKVRELARQVTGVNERFLATKLLDRASIFNIYTQVERSSQKPNPVDETIVEATALSSDARDEEDMVDPVTPFLRHTHTLGQSFEAFGAGRVTDADHVTLVRGEVNGGWFAYLTERFHVNGRRESQRQRVEN